MGTQRRSAVSRERTRITRRELGRLTAGLVAARTVTRSVDAQTPGAPAATYIGPLTGVDRGLEDRRFDPVALARDLYDAAPRRLRFRARTRADAESWQRELGAKLTELVGGFPVDRTALGPQ